MRDATFRYFKAVGDYVVEYSDLKHFTIVSLLLSICCSGVLDFLLYANIGRELGSQT